MLAARTAADGTVNTGTAVKVAATSWWREAAAAAQTRTHGLPTVSPLFAWTCSWKRCCVEAGHSVTFDVIGPPYRRNARHTHADGMGLLYYRDFLTCQPPRDSSMIIETASSAPNE